MPANEIVAEQPVKHTQRTLRVERISETAHADADLAIDAFDEFWIVEDGPAGEVLATVSRSSRGSEEQLARVLAAAPDMLQALREVAADCYALEGVALGPRCVFCLMAEGEPHDADCTMQFVNAAIARAEGRA